MNDNNAGELSTIDLAIVGAGPAGMSAANTAAQRGLKVAVYDEQSRPGGQILRQPPTQFTVVNWLAHRVYKNVKQLLQASTEQSSISWHHRCRVLGIDRDSDGCLRLQIDGPQGLSNQRAQRIIIASGCYDMPVTMRGGNLPGVMATGGIQAFIKSQQFCPGERYVLAGSHPLQLIVADQILAAGGEVAAICFSQPKSAVLRLLSAPLLCLRHADKLGFLLGVIARLLRHRVPIRFSTTVIQANGAQCLESVELASVSRSGKTTRQQKTINCDTLGLCFNFLASSELARQAGAASFWSEDGGGWLIECDHWMQSSAKNLFVAGELTGVAGADASVCEGAIAALGVLHSLGRIDSGDAQRLARRHRRKLTSLNKFASFLRAASFPGKTLLAEIRRDDALLCKCEEVSVGSVREILQANTTISSSNAAKLASRCGMGLCQGRYCHYQLTGLVAECNQFPEAEAGPLTARFPIKPISLRRL